MVSTESFGAFAKLSTMEFSSVLGILHSVGSIDLSSDDSAVGLSLVISLLSSLVLVSEFLLSTTFTSVSLPAINVFFSDVAVDYEDPAFKIIN